METMLSRMIGAPIALKLVLAPDLGSVEADAPPEDMQCAINRFAADGLSAKYCWDPSPPLGASGEGHGGSVSEKADYVADWIAQHTLPRCRGALGTVPADRDE
jgi:hypothetical protein